MSNDMTNEEVKVIRWVEWILAPLLVVSVLGLGQCTASAQDSLILMQQKVATMNKVNGETKQAIRDIKEDANSTKIAIVKIESNQEHFVEEIRAIRESQTNGLKAQEETNRLLRELKRE